MSERTFTTYELNKYSGDRGRTKYIAYKGIVYDVSDCPKWRMAMHENLHWPGQDLTGEMADAPHMDEVFERPCVRRVGILISS